MSASECDPATGIIQPVNGASVRRSRSRPLTASAAVATSASAVALAGDGAAGSSAGGGSGANAASSGSSLSCFGALFSVFRAATDYCRYGNLRQYLLIDPTTGEPKKVGFLTYVRFILYLKCSSNWRRISKLLSNFCCLFTFC